MSRRFTSLAVLVFLLLASGCGMSSADKAFKAIVPELIAPQDGKVFTNYPRFVYLQWKPVSGVRRYLVEVEMGRKEDKTWMPAPPDLNRTFANEEHVQIMFVGAQPGRWRVYAINENDVHSEPSEWWHFEFADVPRPSGI